MLTLLLTGFEPFDKEKINPSWELVKAFDKQTIEGYQIVAVCLPCVFGESLTVLQANIQQYQPEIVLSLGQAGGRVAITPEFVAINYDDARIPDNIGKQPIGHTIIDRAPTAYFSTLPVKAMVQAMIKQGIPASVSYTAGTFVCNHVFFGLQHFAKQFGIKKSGFIHIPYLPEQACSHAGQPSMAMLTLTAALQTMIETVISNDNDINVASGQTH